MLSNQRPDGTLMLDSHLDTVEDTEEQRSSQSQIKSILFIYPEKMQLMTFFFKSKSFKVFSCLNRDSADSVSSESNEHKK